MKNKLFLVAILFVCSKISFAQTSNAILFSENGERFTAILNGLRQNEKPETNVKITGLNAEWYKLKVIFDNTALGEKNFNMGIEQGTETSYSIKKNSKGEYVLRLVSSVPLAEAPAPPATQTVIAYNEHPQNNGTVTHTQTTTTQTSTHGNPNDFSMNMGVNANGDGGNISINVSGMDGTTAETHATTTTTVTHTTTTTYDEDPYPSEPHHSTPTLSYLPGYTGAIGCTPPMTPAEFSEVKESISAKSFEETKIKMAKQILGSRCMFASQVKEIMMLFSFEDSKLDIAKFAYDHTYDIGNYYKLNDAFTFESSTDELTKYVNSRR